MQHTTQKDEHGKDEMVFEGPAIQDYGLVRGDYGLSRGDFWPEKYFDSPPLTAFVAKFELKMTWYDERYDEKRNSKIWVQLCRPSSSYTSNHANFLASEIIKEDEDIFDVAPHKREHATKEQTINDNIVKMAQPGDFFRFMKNIGGGGGLGQKIYKHVYAK